MSCIPCHTYFATHTMLHIQCHTHTLCRTFHATNTKRDILDTCHPTHAMPHIPCHTYHAIHTMPYIHTGKPKHKQTHIHTYTPHTDIQTYMHTYVHTCVCTFVHIAPMLLQVVVMFLRQTWRLANCNAFIKLFVLELHLKLTLNSLSWVNLSGVRNEQRYLLVILRKPWFF